ncbi:MAG TPA: carboxypeptidase-like regulatory domain-containing protein [Bryobacteraceae bacterium]|nr:carboxypeptidase-like regulatory domain-containing protein [Bryobacteraceae bacterium]
MTTRSALTALVVLPACLLIFSQPSSTQEARGTIVGKITDPSGAAVPGATVTVTNKTMGTKQVTNANEVGFYQATYLIPGHYSIEAESAGFRKYVRDDIEVRVNDRIELPIAMEIGAAEQSVTVIGETPLLNTTTASMGTVIDSRRVADLPVPHGNPMFLIGLASGVSFNRDQRLDRPFEPTHIVGYSMDGTRANRSDVTLDGSVATATANAGEVIASYVPPADIIQEFKVQTATFDASFGQTEGGVTNISIKSGTNTLHGTAYYNKMVPSLFANDFFANLNGVPRADFTYNRYGGSVSGPVVIPKLYNGRNKTFFLYGLEGIREDRPRNNGTPTVPTARMKQGDFSELLALGPQYQIYNPFNAREVVVSGSRVIERDPFPGNIIPSNLINPVAKAILGYFPDPLQPGTQNNYLRPELTEHADYLSHTIRGDQFIGSANRMFVRLNWYDRESTYNDYFNNVATGNLFQFVSRAAVIDDVHTLTPMMVVNLRYGYNRFIRGDSGAYKSLGFDLTTLGLPSYLNALTSDDVRKFPRVDLPGYQGTSGGGEWRPNDTHNVNAILSKSQGAHFMRMGTEFRSYRETRREFGNNVTAQFSFDTSWTRGPYYTSPGAPNNQGQTVAALLLGLPSNGGGIARPASYAEQSTSWGFFFQDDWKATRRLSLNLGLRWEFETPLEERFDRSLRGFDPNATFPWEAQARAAYAAVALPERPVADFNLRGGPTFAGVNGNPRGLYETPKRNLMPRFGFAFQATPKTVLRGGYGVFYGFLGQRRGDVIQNGFSRTTDFQFTVNSYLSPSTTLSNPLPGAQLFPIYGASLGAETGILGDLTFFNDHPKMPYMQRWQFGIQRELPGSFLTEISYVGNRGTRLETNRNLNAIPKQYLSGDMIRTPEMVARNTYLGGNLANPFRGLVPVSAPNVNTAANRSRSQLLRPFPHWGDLTTTTNQGYSWYHSLQAQVEKRLSKGFTFQGNYTWSKFMEATAYLNAADPMPVETISDFDVPHRLVASGICDLPFGKGRAFASSVHPVANLLIGGWTLTAIYSYQTGTPLGFGNIAFIGNVNDIKLDHPSREMWFNTKAGFLQDQLQSNIRYFPLRYSFIRVDGVNNWDASLIKNTRFGERPYNLQFKAEFLNALNHVRFPAPNTDPRNAQFGQINASTQANYPRRIQLTAKFVF